MQQCYHLSDPAMEAALIEVPTMHRFAAIVLITERIPDGITIMTFRRFLEQNNLGSEIL
jgi:IS5 family transposase